jgi:hypothetical protein
VSQPVHVRVRKKEAKEVQLNGRTYTLKVCIGYDGRYDVAITELPRNRQPRPVNVIFAGEPRR